MEGMAAMRRARRNELTQGQQRWRSAAESIGRVAARIARQYILALPMNGPERAATRARPPLPR
jgi:hypothetical protein